MIQNTKQLALYVVHLRAADWELRDHVRGLGDLWLTPLGLGFLIRELCEGARVENRRALGT